MQAETKRKLEEDFKEGGSRNATQVFCNSAVAIAVAIAHAFLCRPHVFESTEDIVSAEESRWLDACLRAAFVA